MEGIFSVAYITPFIGLVSPRAAPGAPRLMMAFGGLMGNRLLCCIIKSTDDRIQRVYQELLEGCLHLE